MIPEVFLGFFSKTYIFLLAPLTSFKTHFYFTLVSAYVYPYNQEYSTIKKSVRGENPRNVKHSWKKVL